MNCPTNIYIVGSTNAHVHVSLDTDCFLTAAAGATGNWLFYLEGETYSTILHVVLGVHRRDIQSFILVPYLFNKTFL